MNLADRLIVDKLASNAKFQQMALKGVNAAKGVKSTASAAAADAAAAAKEAAAKAPRRQRTEKSFFSILKDEVMNDVSGAAKK